jgi:hypothetical protein
MKGRIDVLDNDNIALVYGTTTDALKEAADHAAAIRNSGYRATRGDMGQVASIPDFVVMDWCIKRGIPFERFMASNEWNDEFLNSEQAKPYRTWAGRL